jgi:DNA-binding GntR family transcriptional regulator
MSEDMERAAEHRTILEAADAGDPERAAKLLGAHIEVPQRTLRAFASRAISEPGPNHGEQSMVDDR